MNCKKDMKNKKLDIEKINSDYIEKYFLNEKEKSKECYILLFVDGIYNSELSKNDFKNINSKLKNKIIITDFKNIDEKINSTNVDNFFHKSKQKSEKTNELFFYIPENVEIKKPIKSQNINELTIHLYITI